jgi:poly-gamma-glutamate capsule biosynthesis protein CapA/YwtB (metallophosphatase superfamily)
MATEFLFCGDTMLGLDCAQSNPFAGVQSHLQAADIAFCNLETAICDRPGSTSKRHVIAAPSPSLDRLSAAGFDVVNIANNHVLDCGEAACRSMIELLEAKSLSVVGLEQSGRAKPVVLTREGVKIGFLGYADYGFRADLMPLRQRIAISDVTQLSQQVDCVVVSLHWGFE